ncbi:hypothetical protein [Streptomyces sp. NPDC059651]|uniref:hypothetical protein n=1 Tax=Streptomyces sp. NPDC059651 TaxID=3346897 RepID=UPI0036CDD931
MTAIDGRIYVDGFPTPCPPDLEDAADDLERSGGVAWIGLMDPGAEDLETAAARFGLHPLAVEDAHKGHQRAKLERYGDTMFVVGTRPTRTFPAWLRTKVLTRRSR